ncbi:formylglycine-generating enzyme family protein [Anabaena sp. UHCC 0204]|uniref:formylglycine-generating enzyme family protein n=1 Tax=Anabaena sp. UHCC 0204 TaxID=2590009 RepID=UPI0020C3B845|nr:SUMF1/EgtB/PvdO family nonheme iron enzyme [Anabaena sp. UHCC 0204]
MDSRPEIKNTPNWLNLDVLIGLIDTLREAGYSIGVSQYIAAQDLILILISQGENLDNPERLRSLLAPIFCSSPTEQENFKQHFDDLFKPVNQSSYVIEETAEENRTFLEKQTAIKSPYFHLKLLLITIISSGIPLFLIFSDSPSDTPKPTFTPTPTPTPTQPPPTENTNIPDKNSIVCTDNSPINLSENPINIINWPREIAFFLTPSALFLISRMWWFWLTRQLFLRRYGTTTQPELDELTLDFDIEQDLFPRIILMQIARNLRRRIPGSSTQLDIEKTIDATMRQGGWLKPVYRNCQRTPEYLFLVNRTSFQDHQAQFIEEIIERLKKENVLIISYFFDDDPLICFPSQGEGSPLRLNEIINKYDQHYLIIVSDTEQFFSIISGELEPWISQLISWKFRAFFTPKPTTNWGYQEFQIAREFNILPATPQGLQVFSQKPWSEDNLEPFSLPEIGLERDLSAIPIPQTLRTQTYRWLERNSPEPEKIATMLVSLRRYLGDDSFYWFCACAVFPELQWNITIYLGNVLKTKAGKSLLEVCSLNNLARLPWFRSGYIPDWLRVDLIKQLTEEQEQEIRNVLKNLLNQVNETSGNWLKLLIAKTSIKTISEDSPLQDYLFLDFMTKPSLLDLKVPEKFNQLLPKSKNPSSQKTQITRRRFLQMVGLGGVGFVAAVAGNQVLKPKTPEIKRASRTCTFDVLTVDAQGKISNRVSSEATLFIEELGNNITLEMVEIPGGSFIMGSPTSEKGRSDNESPQHEVNVPAFAMGRFAVTQEQYQQIMGKNPSKFKDDGSTALTNQRPVESVSWDNAVDFCNKLSEKTGLKYRLPSEAEWEYACRGRTTTPFHFGETITTNLANYDGTVTYASEPKGKFRGETIEVGSFPPNSFGLYDMHGNVWEWCQADWHDNYTNAPKDGSAWTSLSDGTKVLRGGSWDFNPGACRSALRLNVNRDFGYNVIGFRVVCVSAARTL